MTSHRNINWDFVGEVNRREFNARGKWALTHAPASPHAKLIRKLAVPAGEDVMTMLHRFDATLGTSVASPSPIFSDKSMTGGTAESPTEHHHCHRKHSKLCPKHARNERLRREESVRRGEQPTAIPCARWRPVGRATTCLHPQQRWKGSCGVPNRLL